MKCIVCLIDLRGDSLKVEEKMLGLGGFYEYKRCESCKSLYLVDRDIDFSRFYSNYYSLNKPNKISEKISFFLKTIILGFSLRNKILFNLLIFKNYISHKNNFLWFFYFEKIETSKHKLILDVGCGSGLLLNQLYSAGYKNLYGCDPNIPDNIFNKKYSIYKSELFDLNMQFDVIFFHHSLEHCLNPVNVLGEAYNKLRSGGLCVLRLPIADSFAEKHYGVNWFQMDAPRHINLLSLAAVKKLTETLNFRIEKIIFDSNEIQFWASEAYKSNISLLDITKKRRYKNFFGNQVMKEWEEMASCLNRMGLADQVCVILRKE